MENQVIKTGLKNSIFVLAAQSASFVLGIARALILPILLGVRSFGYWQVYLLYMSYVGIFALGFNDGIYLKYGKFDYKDLPKQIFRTSIKLFVVVQLAIMVLVSLLIFFEPDASKQTAMFWASLNIPIAGLSGVLIYILQVTNQLKKYSFYTVLDKVVVLLIILLVFFLKTNQFILVVIGDTFSKLLVLAFMTYSCRDLLFGKGCSLQTAIKESLENVAVGIKLMLANFAGMLVLGFGRFMVERFDSVEVYGTYSFAISTINLVLVFISAIGLVIYPTLNRLDDNRYANYFQELNKILGILVFGLLIAYFPLRIFIARVMLEYIQIFDYLPIIFVIVFTQTKMQILINPFYKLLRQEKAMLNANLAGLLMAVVLVVSLYAANRSVLMVALGTFIAMSTRLYLSEIYLKKTLSIAKNFNIIIEACGMIIFILFAYQTSLSLGFICYTAVYLIYLISQIKTLSKFAKYFSRR